MGRNLSSPLRCHYFASGALLRVAGILVVQVILLLCNIWVHSPGFNEIGHVPAGLSHWIDGSFELYRVNPPLPRMVGVFPLLFTGCQVDLTTSRSDRFSREEIPCGIQFARANGEKTFRYFRIARLSMIPFVSIGGIVCYLWAAGLWGESAGLMALCLWAFNPSVLGNGAMVMPDVPGAAMGIFAGYTFYKWLKDSSIGNCFAVGLVGGLSVLSKSTLLALVPVGVAISVAAAFANRDRSQDSRIARNWGQGALLIILPIFVINLGYGFTGTLNFLGDGGYQSNLFSGGEPGGNRFRDSVWKRLPVPFPEDFLLGLDRQCADFEIGDRSYLRGEWQPCGWWYYHLYGLVIKSPVGSLLLFAAAICLAFNANFRVCWISELCISLPIVTILVILSLQTGFSNHTRYSLPVIPFASVFAARCASDIGGISILRLTFISGCIFTTIFSGIASCPHSLAYFNCIIGGGRQGHFHLLDSNVSTGQDLLLLKAWMARHPSARPLHLAHFGWVNPRLAGIDFAIPPRGPRIQGQQLTGASEEYGPKPGWYAIDVNFVHGTHWPVAAPDDRFLWMTPGQPNYEYFNSFVPTDWVGNSIAIYHISTSEANNVRLILGLPTLADGMSKNEQPGR